MHISLRWIYHTKWKDFDPSKIFKDHKGQKRTKPQQTHTLNLGHILFDFILLGCSTGKNDESLNFKKMQRKCYFCCNLLILLMAIECIHIFSFFSFFLFYVTVQVILFVLFVHYTFWMRFNRKFLSI